MKQNDFNKLLRTLKNSKGKRQSIIDEVVHIAIDEVNQAGNVTKLNTILLSADYLEQSEKHLVYRWLLDCTTIDKLSVGKSDKGNKTIKLTYSTPKIIWTNSEGLYTYQTKKIEKNIRPFDTESLIIKLIALLQKADSESIDFSNSLKEAKKRIKQKALKANK